MDGRRETNAMQEENRTGQAIVREFCVLVRVHVHQDVCVHVRVRVRARVCRCVGFRFLVVCATVWACQGYPHLHPSGFCFSVFLQNTRPIHVYFDTFLQSEI